MATALADPRLVERLIVEDAAPVAYRSVGEFEVSVSSCNVAPWLKLRCKLNVINIRCKELPNLLDYRRAAWSNIKCLLRSNME